MLIRLLNANDLIGCGDGPLANEIHARHVGVHIGACIEVDIGVCIGVHIGVYLGAHVTYIYKCICEGFFYSIKKLLRDLPIHKRCD